MTFRCPRCKKFLSVAVCLCQLATVSPPFEIENWKFVQLGALPTVVQAADNDQPGKPLRMSFNADSTSTATDDGGSAQMGAVTVDSPLLNSRLLRSRLIG